MEHYVDSGVQLSQLITSKFSVKKDAIPFIDEWESVMINAIASDFRNSVAWSDAIYSLHLKCKAFVTYAGADFDPYKDFFVWIDLWRVCVKSKLNNKLSAARNNALAQTQARAVKPKLYTEEEMAAMKPYYLFSSPLAFDFNAQTRVVVNADLAKNLMWNLNLKRECETELTNLQRVLEMKLAIGLIQYIDCIDSIRNFCRLNAGTEGFYDSKGVLLPTIEKWFLYTKECIKKATEHADNRSSPPPREATGKTPPPSHRPVVKSR